jgi:hypothetical protein
VEGEKPGGKEWVWISLSSLKVFGGVPLYLNGFMPVLGGMHLRGWSREPLFLLPVGMALLNIPSLARQAAPASCYLRLLQLVLIVSFSRYLVSSSALRASAFLKGVVALYGASLVLEAVLVGAAGVRDLFGVWVVRYRGGMGDGNFSALLLGTVALLLFNRRERVWGGVALLLMLPMSSRGVLAAFGLVLVLFGIGRLSREVFRAAAGCCVFFCFLSPLLFLAEGALTPRAMDRLNWVTSGRSQFYAAYARLGMDHPLGGMGYFNARRHVAGYMHPYFQPPDIQEQHSLYLQLFSDFGVLGYGLFAVFLWEVFRRSASAGVEWVLLWVFVLTGLLFLNGLHEWSFWVAAASVVRAGRDARGFIEAA